MLAAHGKRMIQTLENEGINFPLLKGVCAWIAQNSMDLFEQEEEIYKGKASRYHFS